MKLMIVDDHGGVREMIRTLVCEAQDEVCECTSADDAVKAAATFQPDYVTMDLWMSGLNSFKGIQTILKACPSTKVIVVTGYDQRGLRDAALEAGAIHYVVKENLGDLKTIIRPEVPAPAASSENGDPLPHSAADLDPRFRSPITQLTARVEELESFPAFAANELRSPLRSMENFISLLQRPQAAPLPDDAQVCINRISQACRQMNQRIDSLLNYTEFGRQTVQWQTVALDDLVKQCWNEVTANRSEPVQFRLFRLPTVQGDAGLLRIVFYNLLENALKFSAERQSPSVEVNCCDVGSYAVFAVSDNGIGFDMKHVARLFLPLGRLHLADKYPGGGLGLALTRRIVQQHGGRIWAEGKVNQGATFYFTLPRPASTPTNGATHKVG